MRVPNPDEKCIGYRLNILGVRVWKDHCQLVARDSRGAWTPFGPPRPLPVKIPEDPSRVGSDALLITALQYEAERPGSDIRDVLAQKKDFEAALYESGNDSDASESRCVKRNLP